MTTSIAIRPSKTSNRQAKAPPVDSAGARPSLLAATSIIRLADSGEALFAATSVTLRAGDRLALRGPSGVGKSLLLRVLAALDAPDSGELRFRDAPIADGEVPAFRRRVQLVAQAAPMVAGSVRSNLALPFVATKSAKREYDNPRALALLERFELAALIDRPSTQLSGGERQAVALVRALLIEPIVLLLDEPTSAMDPERAAAAEALVDEWHAAGERASVWVSHDKEQLSRTTTTSCKMTKPASNPRRLD